MKHLKILGPLVAAAAITIMALAVSAAATTVTSSTGSTPTIHAVSVGKVVWHNPIATVSCDSTMSGAVVQHGVGVTVKETFATITFTNCEGGTIETVTNPGSIEIHPTAPTGGGIITYTESTIIITTAGVECGYSTKNTPIGELTGGENAMLDIKTSSIPRTHGSFFCGSTGTWTGTYKVVHPTDLTVH